MTNGHRTIQFHLRTLLAIASLGLAHVSNPSGAAADEPTPIVGPSYQGSNNGGAACLTTRQTSGWQPTTPGPWPVFLYFIGTSNPAAFETDPAGSDIVEEMARRGHYALRVQYDSAALPNPLASGWTNAAYFHNKAGCIFDPTRTGSLTNAVCSSPGLDCNRGIAVWGHSQGALMAAMSGNYDGRIRAAVAMGLGPGYGTRAWTREFHLAPNRLRLLNGRQDEGLIFDDKARIGRETTGSLDSLQPGSTAAGWYIVENNEVADGKADHCFFKSGGCTQTGVSDSWWKSGSFVSSLPTTARWLAEQAPADLPSETHFIEFASLPASSTTQITGVYPWGVIDWSTSSNFYVAAGSRLSISDGRHVVIGTNSTPSFAMFSFLGPNGRSLESIDAYYNGSGSATLTVYFEHTDGSFEGPVDLPAVSGGAYSTLTVSRTSVRTVWASSDKGNQLAIAGLTVSG
jgi:hypothetical protein